MSSNIRRFLLLTVLLLALSAVDAKPFFDAIYDAINGNGRRSYGYRGYGSGYGNYGGNDGYGEYGHRAAPPRKGKSWKQICNVHYPNSALSPGPGGIVCPY